MTKTKNKKLCPACGSDEIKEIRIEKQINESFGGSKQIPLKEYNCEVCDFSGDFFSENEQAMQNALSSLKKEAVVNILNYFSENKISLSSMERALELPQRTLTKWKSGSTKPSSSGVTLLKFLGLFPWLLDVAENKYEFATSQKIHLESAFQKMLKCMVSNNIDFVEAGVVTTDISTRLSLHFEKQNNQLETHSDISNLTNPPQISVSLVE